MTKDEVHYVEPMEVYFLEYSMKQKQFHISKISRIVENNLNAIMNERASDWLVISPPIPTLEGAYTYLEKLGSVFDKAAIYHAMKELKEKGDL